MSEILVSPILSAIPGLEHEFGNRLSDLSQDGMARLEQIHSARCLAVNNAGIAGPGDALITGEKDLAVSIRTADCLPILLADARSGAVAAIHAGWRGTAASIVMETIKAMQRQFGTDPSDLYAAIGPGIGECCYSVGEDVGRQLGLDGAGRANLAQINRRQLTSAGIAEARIDILPICTFCDTRFHSFRRDKDRAGRMISYIRMC